MTSTPDRWATFDLVEAFQLGHAVSALQDLDLLASLQRPSTPEALARRHRLDPVLLRTTLEYVAARTDLLRRVGSRFVAAANYSNQAKFLLDLYAGAFREHAVRLADVLRTPWRAHDMVNRARHARAFEAAADVVPAGVPALVQQFQLTRVLDVGSGSGALLIALARQDPAFAGWGLENNLTLARAARRRIRAAGLARRVRILDGDAMRLRSVLPRDVASRIDGVTACQVANEMFGKGAARAVAWLRAMRRALPGRPLLVADYYGRLASGLATRSRETLLHDYAQAISGQGVPPATLEEWRRIYRAAGCTLVHAVEDRTTTRFIHVVVLRIEG